MSKKSISARIFNIIFWIILILVICKLYGVYKTYSYNGFIKAESDIGITTFTRDNKTKYMYDYSYKMDSPKFNDAIFYKKIKVKPNTPYKVSCMVKTKNVETENEKSNGGAQISIADTVESSESIVGTNEWKKVEFIFDSKSREEVEIGFRLGGNETKVKGTAWFSDFKLEEGEKDNTSNWNVACFIMQSIDVNINNENIKINMTRRDVESIKENMERFKNSANDLSNGKMTVEYDIYEISKPVTTITYSQEYGYYLDPLDVQDTIKQYLEKEEYDYIFVAVRLGNIKKNIEIPVNDWIGLRRNGFQRNTDIQIFDFLMTVLVIYTHMINI